MTAGVRRSHFKVESLSAEAKEWVDEQLVRTVDRLTYEQIARQVEDRWGVKLGVSSIHRYRYSFEHQKEKMAFLLSQAEEMTDTLDGAGLELCEAAQAMVASDITDILAEGGHNLATLERLARTVALMGRASAQQTDAKVKYGKAFKAFEERIRKRLQAEVQADDDLLSRLEAAVADEADKATEEAAA
ncbi:MAG: DUF3486 family protein [Nitrospinae bacterium]|nr:DUF3486 family protein [Nitrospinota bacterium]